MSTSISDLRTGGGGFNGGGGMPAKSFGLPDAFNMDGGGMGGGGGGMMTQMGNSMGNIGNPMGNDNQFVEDLLKEFGATGADYSSNINTSALGYAMDGSQVPPEKQLP